MKKKAKQRMDLKSSGLQSSLSILRLIALYFTYIRK